MVNGKLVPMESSTTGNVSFVHIVLRRLGPTHSLRNPMEANFVKNVFEKVLRFVVYSCVENLDFIILHIISTFGKNVQRFSAY